MSSPELANLELLARVDDVVGRLRQWAETDSPWQPMHYGRTLLGRLLARIETLRVRLEAPLVVATFGGTGTGKSSLVNALIGQEVSITGRERPTTTLPVLIAHPDTELDALGLPVDDFRILRSDADILRDIVIVDCPDPDTTEEEVHGSNLERVHRLLPHLDVLIYVSTQQKYRSARVGEELQRAATGCRLLFVQTHAEIDSDIRDDWREQLAGEYEVPEMFFVDSVRALKEQQAGQRPSGDFGRLQDLLRTQLATAERVKIRRANLIDLVHSALEHCQAHIAEHWPVIEQLKDALAQQRISVTEKMADQLREELLVSRNLWERRLLSSVTDIWGLSPFSWVLRFYNGLGSWIASSTFFRARNSAQMALIGAMQGARWLKSRQKELEAEDRLERVSSFGLEDDSLRESQLVVSGYVSQARLDPAMLDRSSLDELRDEAVRVEDRFLGDASRRIDQIIEELARKNSRLFVRAWYELLFCVYLGFVLYRVGKNFFWDTFLKEYFQETPTPAGELLSTDFYISAGVFFLLWSGLLVMFFTRRLRKGLNRKIDTLAQELAQRRTSTGLFPQLEQTCRDLEHQRERLDGIAYATADLRGRLAVSESLGAQIAPRGEAVAVTRSP